jgi:hypothetical protein
MPSYFFPQLADDSVLQAFDASLSQTRAATATMLAYLGELDHRRLYLQAAYPSMHQYCVREKHMSEHTANKRIRVARIARDFPAIFPMLAEGQLSLSAVLLLGPQLTPGTADELLAAAAHRTNAEIELLLVHRFPKPDVPTLVRAIAAPGAGDELAVRRVVPSDGPDLPLQVEPLSGPAGPHARLAPLSPGRFALQVTVDQATHDKLRYAQALLGHALPSGDVANVIERALDALIDRLEKQKFAKCARSRPQRGAPKGRHIPAAVKRAVVERDGGNARSSARWASAARRECAWSMTTWSRSREEGKRPRATCGSGAVHTTSMRLSARSERSSCARSGRRPSAGGRRRRLGRTRRLESRRKMPRTAT